MIGNQLLSTLGSRQQKYAWGRGGNFRLCLSKQEEKRRAESNDKKVRLHWAGLSKEPGGSGELVDHDVIILLTGPHEIRGKVWLIDSVRKSLGFQAEAGVLVVRGRLVVALVSLGALSCRDRSVKKVARVELHSGCRRAQLDLSPGLWILEDGCQVQGRTMGSYLMAPIIERAAAMPPTHVGK